MQNLPHHHNEKHLDAFVWYKNDDDVEFRIEEWRGKRRRRARDLDSAKTEVGRNKADRNKSRALSNHRPTDRRMNRVHAIKNEEYIIPDIL